MKPEWEKYFVSIGIVDLFLDRASRVLEFYEQLYPDQLKQVFVSEYTDKEGMRQYENLWVITERTILEAKNFLKDDDFDATIFKGRIQYWNIRKHEYDFKTVTKQSRMVLIVKFEGEIWAKMKASGENCEHLRRVFIEEIFPNVIRID